MSSFHRTTPKAKKPIDPRAARQEALSNERKEDKKISRECARTQTATLELIKSEPSYLSVHIGNLTKMYQIIQHILEELKTDYKLESHSVLNFLIAQAGKRLAAAQKVGGSGWKILTDLVYDFGDLPQMPFIDGQIIDGTESLSEKEKSILYISLENLEYLMSINNHYVDESFFVNSLILHAYDNTGIVRIINMNDPNDSSGTYSEMRFITGRGFGGKVLKCLPMISMRNNIKNIRVSPVPVFDTDGELTPWVKKLSELSHPYQVTRYPESVDDIKEEGLHYIELSFPQSGGTSKKTRKKNRKSKRKKNRKRNKTRK